MLTIDSLIAYLKKTTDDQWLLDKVRSKDGKRNCVMGHLYDWAGGDDKAPNGRTKGAEAWDWFEEMWATTYMIYPVNDGSHPKYKQETPKLRILAYLNDLKNGLEKTTLEHWADYERDFKDVET